MSKYTQNPDQQWGSYEFVDHSHDNRVLEPDLRNSQAVGDYFSPGGGDGPVGSDMTLPSLPSLSDLSQLGQPDVHGRLQYVPSTLASVVISSLSWTSFHPFQPEAGPTVATRGTASPNLPTSLTIPPSWARTAIDGGRAVLVELAMAKSTNPVFVISADPAYIAQVAQPGGTYAILGIAPALEQAAQAAGPSAPPGVVPGGTSSTQWGTYALIGGGILVGVVVIDALTKKKKKAPVQ